MRHFIHLVDFTTSELANLLDLAAKLKADLLRGLRPALLPGKVLGLIFEKPSLRTRVSFEAAMAQVGGSSIFLSSTDGPIDARESIPDQARTLSQFVDALVLRTFAHKTIEEFAEFSSVPVINGLSDYNHPCQALADVLTIQEAFGDLHGRTVTFVGDGNNVARSLAIACGRFGMNFILAAPKDYGFPEQFLATFRENFDGKNPVHITNPAEAVSSADVIYTDVWTSMGQEAESKARTEAFQGFQVDETLMAKAAPHAKFLHCLPAHRGEEVSAGVADGPQSLIFAQAGNRMHAQKAILVSLLGGKI
jgi:ornithine carbamoyltransferase